MSKRGYVDEAGNFIRGKRMSEKRLLDAFSSSASKQSLIVYVNYVVSRNI